MVRVCIANTDDEALKLHLKLIEFTDSLFTEGSPAGVKAALSIMGIVENNLRLPLVPVTDKHFEYIKGLIYDLQK
jgi:4-hydroxy-tetrahydrodipicolinate synthase